MNKVFTFNFFFPVSKERKNDKRIISDVDSLYIAPTIKYHFLRMTIHMLTVKTTRTKGNNLIL